MRAGIHEFRKVTNSLEIRFALPLKLGRHALERRPVLRRQAASTEHPALQRTGAVVRLMIFCAGIKLAASYNAENSKTFPSKAESGFCPANGTVSMKEYVAEKTHEPRVIADSNYDDPGLSFFSVKVPTLLRPSAFRIDNH